MSMYSESLRAFLKPINAFLDDESVTEVMINAPDEIWIERGGKVFRTDARFTEEGLLAAARNIGQFVGRVLNDERPRLDARLPDGSRIHVVLPPVARRGPVVAIRKFFQDKLGMEKLIGFGAATPQLARIIEAAVRLKLNIIVAGGTGSGKTTLLNVVGQYIPEDERIITIEDSAELQMNQPHIVGFESRPPDKFGKGEVTLGDLLNSSLRLRPDRIVVGEVRGGEAFHLLQAMNTGHGGSLATTHANTPVDTLRRIESLCLMSGIELPMVAVRAQVASAIDLVICCERLVDGSRKITHVAEVLPLNEKGEYRTQDLYLYTVTGKTPEGKLLGYHAPTGILPTFASRLKSYGFDDMDEAFFDPATYKLRPPPATHTDDAHTTRWAPSLRHREQGEADPEPTPEELAAHEEAIKPPPVPEVETPAEPEPVAEAQAEGVPEANDAAAHEPVPEVVEEAAAEAATLAAVPVVPAWPVVDEPSIQIAPELLEEVGRVVGNQETHVKRNPLLDSQRPASPMAPRVGQPSAPRRNPLDEKTDPHIRVPPRK